MGSLLQAPLSGRLFGDDFEIRSPSKIVIFGNARLTLGKRVVIEKDARIVVRATMSIGNDTYVGKNATLIAFNDLTIGDRVLLGENVSIHTENHGPAGDRNAYTTQPIKIEPDVWIAAGVVVLPGADIGRGTTIGANAVVNKPIPANVLAVGAPARVVRDALPRPNG